MVEDYLLKPSLINIFDVSIDSNDPVKMLLIAPNQRELDSASVLNFVACFCLSVWYYDPHIYYTA